VIPTPQEGVIELGLANDRIPTAIGRAHVAREFRGNGGPRCTVLLGPTWLVLTALSTAT